MRQNFILAFALILVTVAVFWPVGRHDYINLDDQAYVSENPPVKAGLTAQGVRWAFTTHHGGSWHPVTWLSHMLDVELFGLKPGPQHLLSVAIHAVSGALLFLALFALTRARWESLAVAALFALHPLRVESVAWIAERKDVLSGFWFMAVLLAYARYVQASRDSGAKSKAWYGATLGFFLLGLMSKPMLVSVPLVLLLLDVWPLKRVDLAAFHFPAAVRLLREKIPFLLMTAVFCGLTLRSQHDVGAVISVEGLSLTNRAANALNSIVRYCTDLLWPARLNFFYAFDEPLLARTLLWFALIGLVTLAAWWLRRLKPYLLTGWLWYLVMLVPVLGLVQVGSAARADRYTYLPSIGLLIALVWLASEIVPRTKIGRILLATMGVGILTALALTTRHQLQFWQNGITLCERSIALEPRDARSHFNLGCTLEKLGDRDGAIPHFTAAIALSPAYTKAHNNLGSALAGKGDFAGAETHFRAALQINASHTSARLNLVRALASQGKLAEALAQLEGTPPKDQSSPAVLALTGDVLLGLGKVREAAPYLVRLAQGNPSPDLHAKIATLYIQLADPQTAVTHYRAALQLKPDWEQVLNNLAWTLATNPDPALRNGAEAVSLAGRACALTQNQQPGFLATLAAAQAEAGLFDQAVVTAQKALDLANHSGNAQLAAGIAPLHATFVNRQPYHTPPVSPAAPGAKP